MIRPRSTVRCLLLPVAMALVVTACSSASSSSAPPTTTSGAVYPVTVTNCGHTYTFTKAPTRVLIGYPTQIETLAALGVQKSVIGYLSGSLSPLPAGYSGIPVVSPQYEASREVILGATPDFFLMDSYQQANGTNGTPATSDLLAAGANAYAMQGNCAQNTGATSVDGIYDDLTNLGKIFGVENRAAALVAKLKNQLSAASALRGNRPEVKVATIQIYAGKVYAMSGGGHGVVLSAGAGFINEFASLTGEFAQVSPEQVLTLNTDWIFAAYSPPDTPATTLNEVKTTLAGSSAVMDGHVLPLDNNGVEVGGIPLFNLVIQADQAVYGGGGTTSTS